MIRWVQWGEDMGNLIRKHEHLKRKYKREIASESETNGVAVKNGCGYEKWNTNNKAPTSIFVGVDAPKAPTI